MPTATATISASALPWFPVEIIERIISEVWNQPLPTSTRIKFMTSSLLVNKMWASNYLRVSSIDAHIPSPSYVNKFFELVHGKTSLYNFDPSLKSYPERFCRSLTFTMPNTSVVPKKEDLVAARALFYVMNKLQPTATILPHLKRIAIHFENYLYEDLADYPCFYYFPKYVPELEVRYFFHSQAPSFVLDALHENKTRSTRMVRSGWVLKSLTKLTVIGASDGLTMDWISRCPVLEDCVVDDYVRLDKDFQFPASLHEIKHPNRPSILLKTNSEKS